MSKYYKNIDSLKQIESNEGRLLQQRLHILSGLYSETIFEKINPIKNGCIVSFPENTNCTPEIYQKLFRSDSKSDSEMISIAKKLNDSSFLKVKECYKRDKSHSNMIFPKNKKTLVGHKNKPRGSFSAIVRNYSSEFNHHNQNVKTRLRNFIQNRERGVKSDRIMKIKARRWVLKNLSPSKKDLLLFLEYNKNTPEMASSLSACVEASQIPIICSVRKKSGPKLNTLNSVKTNSCKTHEYFLLENPKTLPNISSVQNKNKSNALSNDKEKLEHEAVSTKTQLSDSMGLNFDGITANDTCMTLRACIRNVYERLNLNMLELNKLLEQDKNELTRDDNNQEIFNDQLNFIKNNILIELSCLDIYKDSKNIGKIIRDTKLRQDSKADKVAYDDIMSFSRYNTLVRGLKNKSNLKTYNLEDVRGYLSLLLEFLEKTKI